MGAAVQAMEGNLEHNRLHTICQEACCPNQGECFSKGVATFLIMGASAPATAVSAPWIPGAPPRWTLTNPCASPKK